MNTTQTVLLSLAIGIPLIFAGALFYHGETEGVKAPLGQTGLPQYGGKSKTRNRRRKHNKTRKH